MPRNDGTGPQGQGSLTGRELGRSDNGGSTDLGQGQTFGQRIVSGFRNVFRWGQRQGPGGSGSQRGQGRSGGRGRKR